MRVLHVIPSMAARDGGPAVAMRSMAAALACAGVDVTVATTDADGPARLDVPLHEPVVEDGVTYHYFARAGHGGWKFSWSLTRWIAEQAADFDVITAHALFSYATIPTCFAARRARVPYIIRPLGTLGTFSLQQKAWKKRPYYRMIERPHLEGASAIHVTSRAEADAVSRLGFGVRARLIELGVDLPEPNRDRAHDPETTRLLFLSRLHPTKNVPLLLDAVATAMQQGARLRLDIAGGGSAEYVSLLVNRARALGISEHVRFLGEVVGDTKRQAFQAADVFVLPSSHENFGIAVAEALAAGLPVVVSDQVGIADAVAEHRAGFVVPLDVVGLARAIMTLCDRTTAVAMGERARDLAEHRYSWNRVARQLMSLYEEVSRTDARRLTA